MINTYLEIDNKISKSSEVTINPSTVWIDVVDMTEAEERLMEEALKIDIPSAKEIAKIEISNKLYMENGALYAAFLFPNENRKVASNYWVTFILLRNTLITVRYCNKLKPFTHFIAKMESYSYEHKDVKLIILDIIGVMVERLSDILGEIRVDIDKINHLIFASQENSESETKVDYLEILKKIGRVGNLLSKSQESLLSFSRVGHYYKESVAFHSKKQHHATLDILLADIHSLYEHAVFLSGETSFSLNSSLGMISIEQSNIVRIVSVVPLIFLPPTLIASIYGMNFDFMPELKYGLGYPLSLLAMLVSAWLPYKFCKKKKWL